MLKARRRNYCWLCSWLRHPEVLEREPPSRGRNQPEKSSKEGCWWVQFPKSSEVDPCLLIFLHLPVGAASEVSGAQSTTRTERLEAAVEEAAIQYWSE